MPIKAHMTEIEISSTYSVYTDHHVVRLHHPFSRKMSDTERCY